MREIKKNIPSDGKGIKKAPDKSSAMLFLFKFFDAADE